MGVGRRVVVVGQRHAIRCARRADLSCPAGEFLDALKVGMWVQDPDAEVLPSDEQIGDRAWLLNAMRYWANEGEPQYRGSVNYLRSGIWEFKRGSKRLTFYDTDGRGGYVEKAMIRDHRAAEYPDSAYWQIPGFDHEIRLGHPFPKLGQRTSEADLDDSETVREEDLAHDRE